MTRISRITAPRASILAIVLLALAMLGVAALADRETVSPVAAAEAVLQTETARAEHHPCGLAWEDQR